MFVHRMGAIEEPAEILRTNRYHQRQTDGRPYRIAAADPIPETENTIRGNTESVHLVQRCRNGGEVFADCLLAKCIGDPFARCLRVGHGLDGGESFRSDDDQRRCRIETGKRIGDMRAIDVGDECSLGPSWYGDMASVAMAGPRSEPPMPILTMSVIGLFFEP